MKQRQPLSDLGFIVLAIMIIMLATTFNRRNYGRKTTTQEFLTELEAGSMASAILKPNKETPTGELILPMKDSKEKQLYRSDVEMTETFLLEHGVSYKLESVPQENYLLTIMLPIITPAVMLVGLFMFINVRAAGDDGANTKMMNFGKGRAKMSKETDKTNSKKVAGLQEEKGDLEELVDFLRSPQKYTAVGTRISRGVTLVDPPGTGKTLLAKAVVGGAGVPFFSISGSDFVEMFVGVGAPRARDLFEETKKNAPCITFIDEVDVVAGRRDTSIGGSHDEKGQILDQLLAEMDGFGVSEGIIVMAATNCVDILDPAILRLGRSDRKIGVGRPGVKGREEIPEVYSKEEPLGEDVDLNRVARITSGFTDADLGNLLSEAAIMAARERRKLIQQADIDRSFIKMGTSTEKRSEVIPEKEKGITAYYETEHAISLHVSPDVGPVHTISTTSTGMRAAGYTMPLLENDELSNNRGGMLQNIMVSLGRRIAEEIIFDDVATGASQDIKQVMSIARAMMTRYGMSDKIGVIDYDNDDDEVFIGRNLAHTKNYEEHVASAIDSEVKRITDECYEKARAIIQEHVSVLHRCTELLIEREKIGQKEFGSLFE